MKNTERFDQTEQQKGLITHQIFSSGPEYQQRRHEDTSIRRFVSSQLLINSISLTFCSDFTAGKCKTPARPGGPGAPAEALELCDLPDKNTN